MNPFLLALASYLLGAIPTSYWVGRVFHGVDLRREGSGNLGATNTYRVLGAGAGLPVVVADVLKGWIPAAFFWQIDAPTASWAWALAYGAAAIVGHVFSVFVRFRGGKGVATSAGVFLALSPWGVLAGVAVFAVTVAATRIVSLGSLLAAAVLPFAVVFAPSPWPPAAQGTLLAFSVALALFVIWAHRANVGRLLRGEENRFGRTRGGGSGEPPEGPGGPEGSARIEEVR